MGYRDYMNRTMQRAQLANEDLERAARERQANFDRNLVKKKQEGQQALAASIRQIPDAVLDPSFRNMAAAAAESGNADSVLGPTMRRISEVKERQRVETLGKTFRENLLASSALAGAGEEYVEAIRLIPDNLVVDKGLPILFDLAKNSKDVYGRKGIADAFGSLLASQGVKSGPETNKLLKAYIETGETSLLKALPFKTPDVGYERLTGQVDATYGQAMQLVNAAHEAGVDPVRVMRARAHAESMQGLKAGDPNAGSKLASIMGEVSDILGGFDPGNLKASGGGRGVGKANNYYKNRLDNLEKLIQTMEDGPKKQQAQRLFGTLSSQYAAGTPLKAPVLDMAWRLATGLGAIPDIPQPGDDKLPPWDPNYSGPVKGKAELAKDMIVGSLTKLGEFIPELVTGAYELSPLPDVGDAIADWEGYLDGKGVPDGTKQMIAGYLGALTGTGRYIKMLMGTGLGTTSALSDEEQREFYEQFGVTLPHGSYADESIMRGVYAGARIGGGIFFDLNKMAMGALGALGEEGWDVDAAFQELAWRTTHDDPHIKESFDRAVAYYSDPKNKGSLAKNYDKIFGEGAYNAMLKTAGDIGFEVLGSDWDVPLALADVTNIGKLKNGVLKAHVAKYGTSSPYYFRFNKWKPLPGARGSSKFKKGALGKFGMEVLNPKKHKAVAKPPTKFEAVAITPRSGARISAGMAEFKARRAGVVDSLKSGQWVKNLAPKTSKAMNKATAVELGKQAADAVRSMDEAQTKEFVQKMEEEVEKIEATDATPEEKAAAIAQVPSEVASKITGPKITAETQFADKADPDVYSNQLQGAVRPVPEGKRRVKIGEDQAGHLEGGLPFEENSLRIPDEDVPARRPDPHDDPGVLTVEGSKFVNSDGGRTGLPPDVPPEMRVRSPLENLSEEINSMTVESEVPDFVKELGVPKEQVGRIASTLEVAKQDLERGVPVDDVESMLRQVFGESDYKMQRQLGERIVQAWRKRTLGERKIRRRLVQDIHGHLKGKGDSAIRKGYRSIVNGTPKHERPRLLREFDRVSAEVGRAYQQIRAEQLGNQGTVLDASGKPVGQSILQIEQRADRALRSPFKKLDQIGDASKKKDVTNKIKESIRKSVVRLGLEQAPRQNVDANGFIRGLGQQEALRGEISSRHTLGPRPSTEGQRAQPTTSDVEAFKERIRQNIAEGNARRYKHVDMAERVHREGARPVAQGRAEGNSLSRDPLGELLKR